MAEPDNRSMRRRMLAGDLYIARDPELGRISRRAQSLMQVFNAPSTPIGERSRVMGQLLGSMGEDVEIRAPFYCDYGENIHVGNGVFMNFDCVILDCNVVRIGDRVLFGPKVQIYTATHPMDPEIRRDGWEMAHPITIEDDVWIGGGAIVSPGVTIGRGSTVGAGSVVTRDVPAGVFAAGNPCRVIRRLDVGGS